MKVHELIEYLKDSPQDWSVHVIIRGWDCVVEAEHLLEDSGICIELEPEEFNGKNSRVRNPFVPKIT